MDPKLMGNWSGEDVTVTQIENGVLQTYVILNGTSLLLPLSDDEVAERDNRITAAADDEAARETAAAAAALVEIRMMRDRWLDQCQIIFAQIDGANIGTLPTEIDSAITANAAAWGAWRQAMRDLPTQITDPVSAVAAMRNVHATTDTWPAPWPQPPAAPVKHLT